MQLRAYRLPGGYAVDFAIRRAQGMAQLGQLTIATTSDGPRVTALELGALQRQPPAGPGELSQ